MQPRNRFRTQAPGFTMIEILMVVLVIGILLALLMPAIVGAVRSARAASGTAEINALATALAQFKSKFNDYPPSRILVYETGYYPVNSTATLQGQYGDTRTDVTEGQLAQRSLRYLQKFFPRAAVFSAVPGNAIPCDANGDGKVGDQVPFLLSGDECLVYFLGGSATYGQTTGGKSIIALSGFSRNPANPFDRSGSSRSQPLYEFKSDRLVDPDGDGFPSYLDVYGAQDDNLARPYAYFSSYGSGSYDPNDVNTLAVADPFSRPNRQWQDPHGVDPASPDFDAFPRAFKVQFPVNSSSLNSCYSRMSACISPGPNPYTASVPVNRAAPDAPVIWQNPETFQIVSAGADQLFGIGGSFSTQTNAGRLSYPDGPKAGLCSGQSTLSREPEQDNLSSFTNARLD